MKPWCAEGEVPTVANLNFYRGGNPCVGWHRDDELLFGKCGDAKLIVSVSLGTFAVFRWRHQSCLDDEGHLCCLGHGDILVVDGRCQDRLLHRTDPCREQERINITFRWVKQHVSSCPLFKAGVACCLPTCAQGLSAPVMENSGNCIFWVFWLLFCVLCAWGVLALLVSLLHTRLGFLWCVSCWTRPFGVVQPTSHQFWKTSFLLSSRRPGKLSFSSSFAMWPSAGKVPSGWSGNISSFWRSAGKKEKRKKKKNRRRRRRRVEKMKKEKMNFVKQVQWDKVFPFLLKEQGKPACLSSTLI